MLIIAGTSDPTNHYLFLRNPGRRMMPGMEDRGATSATPQSVRTPPDTVSLNPGPPPGLHRRLTVNSLTNLSRYGFSLLISFFLTPFVVRTLGDSVYGFWLVMLSFLGYAGVLELGMQPAVIKVVSQHREQDERANLEELLAAAFVFFAGVGLVAALVLAFALPLLIPIIVRDAPAIMRSWPLYAVISVDVLLMFLNLFLTGVLCGRQLYSIKNLLDIASMCVNAILLLLFLKQGGLMLLVSAKLTCDLLSLAATALVVRRSMRGYRLRMRRANRSSLRELLQFGGRLFLSATTTRIASNAHPMVISARISAAATTFFAIPVRLVDYAREITWSLATGFMPAFSQLQSQAASQTIHSVYIRYSRYIFAATLPIYIVILAYGSEFVGFWIGPEYGAQARIPIVLVSAAALTENLQPLYWRLFIGVGRLNTPVAISASAALASIAIGLLLAPTLGIVGPALAILSTGVVAQSLFILDAAKYLRERPGKMIASLAGRPLIAGLGLYAFALGIERTIGTYQPLRLGLAVLVTLAVYVPLAFGIVLDTEERRALRHRVGKAIGLGRPRP